MFRHVEIDASVSSPPFTPMISPFTPNSQLRRLMSEYERYSDSIIRNDIVDISDEKVEIEKSRCCPWFYRFRKAK
jgi:hypothetical protein